MISKMKILVVGKDPGLSRMLSQELPDAEYEVAAAYKVGEELRDTLSSEQPDMVILDIMMPDMEGIEVCLRIRQWSLVPVIMLSTWGVSAGKMRGLNLSDDTYLTPPFGVEELKKRMEEAVRRNAAALKRMTNIYPRVPMSH